jgi:hypothetical protein
MMIPPTSHRVGPITSARARKHSAQNTRFVIFRPVGTAGHAPPAPSLGEPAGAGVTFVAFNASQSSAYR